MSLNKTLQEYFEKTQSNHIVFIDNLKKILFLVYNDKIMEIDTQNVFYGFRDLNDIINTSNNRDTLKICPIHQFNERIKNGRYIFCGSEYKTLLHMLNDQNFDECIFELGNNWKDFIEKYRSNYNNTMNVEELDESI